MNSDALIKRRQFLLQVAGLGLAATAVTTFGSLAMADDGGNNSGGGSESHSESHDSGSHDSSHDSHDDSDDDSDDDESDDSDESDDDSGSTTPPAAKTVCTVFNPCPTKK